MKLFLRILNGAISVFLVLVIAAAGILAISARRSHDAIPTILGRKVLTVLSGSMAPTIHTGDVIIIKPVQNPASDLKDGDVITFRVKEQPNMLITHRITGTVLANGKPVAYTTQGDANPSADSGMIAVDQVIGRYQWRVPYFGYLSSFVRKPVGIILCVVLPGLVLVGLEFRKMWITLAEAEAEKETAEAERGDQKEE